MGEKWLEMLRMLADLLIISREKTVRGRLRVVAGSEDWLADRSAYKGLPVKQDWLKPRMVDHAPGAHDDIANAVGGVGAVASSVGSVWMNLAWEEMIDFRARKPQHLAAFDPDDRIGALRRACTIRRTPVQSSINFSGGHAAPISVTRTFNK
jgi:hypothetical protein